MQELEKDYKNKFMTDKLKWRIKEAFDYYKLNLIGNHRQN